MFIFIFAFLVSITSSMLYLFRNFLYWAYQFVFGCQMYSFVISLMGTCLASAAKACVAGSYVMGRLHMGYFWLTHAL